MPLFRQPIHIEVIGKNELSVDGETYAQIAPYVFQSLETGRKCGFQVENGKVIKFSDMLDYLPVSQLTGVRNISTFGVFFLFIVVSAVSWIRFIIDLVKKQKNPLHKFFLMENGIFASVIAVLFIIIKHISTWDRAKEFIVYPITNCVLVFLLCILTFGGLMVTKKDNTKGSWIYRIYAFVLLILICFAAWWGLFSIEI